MNANDCREYLKKVRSGNWEMALLTELNPNGDGEVWLREEEECVDSVHDRKAGVMFINGRLEKRRKKGQKK